MGVQGAAMWDAPEPTRHYDQSACARAVKSATGRWDAVEYQDGMHGCCCCIAPSERDSVLATVRMPCSAPGREWSSARAITEEALAFALINPRGFTVHHCMPSSPPASYTGSRTLPARTNLWSQIVLVARQIAHIGNALSCSSH